MEPLRCVARHTRSRASKRPGQRLEVQGRNGHLDGTARLWLAQFVRFYGLLDREHAGHEVAWGSAIRGITKL